MASQILVCWSGGCDSTLLLYHAARIYGTKGWPVRALSIKSSQVAARTRESQARTRILKYFKKKGLHVSHSEMSITVDKGEGLAHYGLPQATMWLIGMQFLQVKETYGLGYIKGDDWVIYKHEFEQTFKLLQQVSERTGTIWTPMTSMEKRGVIHQLDDFGLLKLVWWCEVPDGHKSSKPCGKCNSCATHETGVWKLKNHGPGYLWDGEKE